MYISRNDAKFNTDVCHQKDTIISAHTLMKLGRNNYSPQEMAAINAVRQRNKMKRGMAS